MPDNASLFAKISSIDLANDASWRDRLFLTIDIDWACDAVIHYCIDAVEAANVEATWFITHDTPTLTRLRANTKFELGIHPNFNPLLQGSHEKGKNAEDVLTSMLEIVPEAVSIRSHSMTQSSQLLNLFEKHRLKFDSNHFIPHEANIALAPWRHWNGMIKAPYFWEDDVECLGNWRATPANLIQKKGLKIFDFHPIHVFLNTETLDRYNAARDYLGDFSRLVDFQNSKTTGTKNYLMELIGTTSCA